MVVLDTYVWVWWIGGPGCPSLSVAARKAIADAAVIGVTATSCVEVAWLTARGRVKFDRDTLTWLQQALARPRVALLPTTPEIAVVAATLEWEHRDPSDRLIVAASITHRAPLVTADAAILASGLARTIW